MIILDENITKPQRELLASWRIAARQIGVSIGRKGMSDEEIIPLLQRLRQPVFFTRDEDFYDHNLCHAGYSIVFLAVGKNEAAVFIRRLLRHSEFRTQAKRAGKIIRVSHAGISFWQRHQHKERQVGWR